MDSQSQPVRPDFSTVRFVYFDLDDTLIDHKRAQERALVDVWTQYPELQKIEPLVLASEFARANHRLWEAYRNSEVGQSELRRLRFEQTFRQLGVTAPDWREVDQVYMECYERHWDWIPGARDALVQISRHYPTGIVTNGFTFVQKKKFEYFSLNRHTRHLIISEEVGHLKPHPHIFAFAAEKSGHAPSELLYVGDSYASDIAGGHRCGWSTAWFHKDDRQPDQNLADLVFSSFHELLEALHIHPPNHST
jgi:HAD superfamily hydrolase (TIGR01549 family)